MKMIMISLDTLRADRLGCYGYNKPTSPYIDQIAREGVLFERAYASDIPTEVAHTSIFTGKIGLETGIVSHGSELTHLPKSVPWLPTMLRQAGVTTAAVDNLYQLKEWFARGYRYYINSSGSLRNIDGRTINDLAMPWLTEHKDESFFLFLHYWDPHTPYLPPEHYVPEFYDASRDPFDPENRKMDTAYNHIAYPFFKHHHYDLTGPVTDPEYYNALYDAEVRYLDDLLKELDEHLDTLGIREETMVVLFGDHGESLTEHNIYWDHCGLYEQTVHVPVIMRWPGKIPAGKRISGMVQHADLMPTILEAAKQSEDPSLKTSALELPEALDGISLWPSIRGEQNGTRSRVYLSECAWQAARGIRTETHKFIRTYDGGPYIRPERELYDLETDPEELINLAESMPELADQLEQELEHWVMQTLRGRSDPMKVQLEKAGLPFRKRIEQILRGVGLEWDEWIANPCRELFDQRVQAKQETDKA